MNVGRIERRRRYGTLQAVRDAFEPLTPQSYFQAFFETEEEATAQWELHRSRCDSIINSSE